MSKIYPDLNLLCRLFCSVFFLFSRLFVCSFILTMKNDTILIACIVYWNVLLMTEKWEQKIHKFKSQNNIIDCAKTIENFARQISWNWLREGKIMFCIHEFCKYILFAHSPYTFYNEYCIEPWMDNHKMKCTFLCLVFQCLSIVFYILYFIE